MPETINRPKSGKKKKLTLFNVYSLYPVEPVRGKGCFVYDAAGTEYLDLYGGHAVISIGHAQPDYVRAVQEQVARLGFYSNSVENTLQRTLAEKLGRISGYDDYRLFLCNSGAEANENALKLASFHTGRSKVLAISKAFHGRTSGAVAVTETPPSGRRSTGRPTWKSPPLNDLEAARAKLATREFAAVIIEGIQGVSGIHCPTDEFLRGLRAAATETGTQLVLDEIQSGYGRTGRFFAHQWAGIRPDLITMAKGMGNGFPIGGVLIAPHFEARPGLLGTTFGGSHLACAAAIAVLEVIERDGLVKNAAAVGEYLFGRVAPNELLEGGARPRPHDRHRDRRFGRGIPQKTPFRKTRLHGRGGLFRPSAAARALPDARNGRPLFPRK